tara:strand:+ start:390 stop:617 length:228 start_codon:yes stop_codon:yes gene_type:complete
MQLLREAGRLASDVKEIAQEAAPVAKKAKKKISSYNRKYKAAFKKIAPKYKLKSGRWKKGGFKRAVKQAHRMVKK